MEDLISRQAAIEVADAVWSVTGDVNVAKVWDSLNHLPSAQPERIRGKWIDDGSELGCCCSECGKTLDEYFDGGTEIRLLEIPHFCPNCGADMRI